MCVSSQRVALAELLSELGVRGLPSCKVITDQSWKRFTTQWSSVQSPLSIMETELIEDFLYVDRNITGLNFFPFLFYASLITWVITRSACFKVLGPLVPTSKINCCLKLQVISSSSRCVYFTIRNFMLVRTSARLYRSGADVKVSFLTCENEI